MNDTRLFDRIFWLHIKKSAGISTRAVLGDAYVEVDRDRRPANFLQSPREQWNDILNNFRVVLGEYQFRRALFAKEWLYPQDWDSRLSFAFSREPVSRAVSMFLYLFWRGGSLRNILADNINLLRTVRRPIWRTSTAFDVFLDLLEMRLSQDHDSNFLPMDLHFTTHTARMFEDVADREGNILLSRIYRLESFAPAIREVLSEVGAPPPLEPEQRRNLNRKSTSYEPNRTQRARLERLYDRDFEIYENALVR